MFSLLKEMTVMDVFSFSTIFNNNSPEHLLIWLTQFTIHSQVCFINMLTNQKIKKIKAAVIKEALVKNHKVTECYCSLVYKTMDQKFREQIPLEIFNVCVPQDFYNKLGSAMNNVSTVSENIIVNTNILTTVEPIYLKLPKLYTVLMDAVKRKQNINPGNNSASTNDLDEPNVTISEVYNNKFTIYALLHRLNVCELYTLYRMPVLFTRRDFERLLPEYWRSFNRSVYETKTVEPINLIESIYRHHSLTAILQSNTMNKLTFKLSEIDRIPYNEDYFSNKNYVIQPKLSGMRVVISKTLDSGYIISNAHGCKIKMLEYSFLIKNPLNYRFSGEFILMVKNNTNPKILMNIEHYTSNSELQIIIVDLFSWEGSNLLTINYEDRLLLMNEFVKEMPNITMINSIELEQVNELKNLHKKELLLYGSSHFSGFIIRSLIVNYARSLKCMTFNINKCSIFYPYNILDTFTNINIEDKNYTHYIIKDSFKYSINLPVYDYDENTNIIKIATFKNFEYVHLQSLVLNYKIHNWSKYIPKSNRLYINRQNYSWIVFTFKFNNINKDSHLMADVVKAIKKPTLSLLDCGSYQTL